MLPSLLRPKRLFISYAVLIGSALLAIWSQYFYVTTRPEYVDGGGGAAFGVAMFALLTIFFIFSVALRMLIDPVITVVISRLRHPNQVTTGISWVRVAALGALIGFIVYVASYTHIRGGWSFALVPLFSVASVAIGHYFRLYEARP